MMRIAALLTVHNRKEKTLKCLRALKAQKLPVGCEIDIYLTDDGCTDGTPEAIASEFPGINIVKGDGNLFWNRGMYRAWEAASNAYDYDWYLWLNDDTILYGNALKLLIETSVENGYAVAVGPTCAMDNSRKTTYSGFDKKSTLLTPNGKSQRCFTFHGNIVLVPRLVFKKVGNLDPFYHHDLGDIDYGHCVSREGLSSYITPSYCGCCDNNPRKPAWMRTDVRFIERWRNYHSPLAYGEPRALFHFNRKNYGLFHAIKVWSFNHIRLFFPFLKN